MAKGLHPGGVYDRAVINRANRRSDRARTPGAGSGNGLGLPIVRTIVAAHRGTVDLRNRPPGCEVTIELPRAAVGAKIHE